MCKKSFFFPETNYTFNSFDYGKRIINMANFKGFHWNIFVDHKL